MKTQISTQFVGCGKGVGPGPCPGLHGVNGRPSDHGLGRGKAQGSGAGPICRSPQSSCQRSLGWAGPNRHFPAGKDSVRVLPQMSSNWSDASIKAILASQANAPA